MSINGLTGSAYEKVVQRYKVFPNYRKLEGQKSKAIWKFNKFRILLLFIMKRFFFDA